MSKKNVALGSRQILQFAAYLYPRILERADYTVDRRDLAGALRKMPAEIPQEGFVRRLMFYWCACALKRGDSESTFFVGDPYTRRLTRAEMQAFVDYAQKWGFLPPENAPHE